MNMERCILGAWCRMVLVDISHWHHIRNIILRSSSPSREDICRCGTSAGNGVGHKTEGDCMARDTHARSRCSSTGCICACHTGVSGRDERARTFEKSFNERYTFGHFFSHLASSALVVNLAQAISLSMCPQRHLTIVVSEHGGQGPE